MKILAIDTSTNSGSVAINNGDNLISELTLNIGVTHSETLLPSLDNMLKEAGLTLQEIDLLALTVGPGSFTGIRIGVSTMKGLSLALGKPLAGVSTLEAMASNFPYSEYIVSPVMDARRGELYTADFRWNGEDLERLSEDRAISPENMIKDVKEKTIFAGDGTIKYGEMIKEGLGKMAIFAPQIFGYVRASIVARIALKRFEDGETLDLDRFTPSYLRRSEAEIKREKGLLQNC